MNSTVNERIKEIRKNKHYTQEQAGELIGMKCSTYSQMERKGSISVEMALDLAKAFGTDPYYIIFGETKENLFDSTPLVPEVLTANEPENFINLIKNSQEELILSQREKNIIKNLRLLKEKDKSDVIEYIKSKLK
jgi:transcriptional regulator with XRE-family HTH domain